MYVYIKSEPGIYTVGFYTPGNKWVAESDHSSARDAAARCNYLNGGSGEASGVNIKPNTSGGTWGTSKS
jgi:hypothetical protein